MRWLPGLPILGRELLEISARRRTYAVRVGLLLIGLTSLSAAINKLLDYNVTWSANYWRYINIGIHGIPAPSIGIIGQGVGLILPVLINLLVISMCQLPTLSTLSVAEEREQGTLVLLLLTPQHPASLILQKYLSLLLWCLSFLVISLPLLAVGYLAGGLDSTWLMSQVIMTCDFMMQTAAIGLAVGCWCRRPMSALIIANLAVALLHLICLMGASWRAPHANHWGVALVHQSAVPPLWTLLSPALIPACTSAPAGVLAGAYAAPLILTLVMLMLAYRGITRHPEAGGSGLLQGGFLALDRWWESLDARWFRRTRARELPDANPMLWLEVNRRALCNLRYLVRMLLPVAALLILISLMTVSSSTGWSSQMSQRLELIFAVAVVLAAAVQATLSSGILAREVADQVLEVLLTTPLTPAAIVRDKARALSRIRWGLTICLLLIVGVQYIELPDLASFQNDPREHAFNSLIVYQLILALLVPAISGWAGFLIGLLVRNQRRAALLALASVFGWLMGQVLLVELPASYSPVMRMNPYAFGEPTALSLWQILLDPIEPLVSPAGTQSLVGADLAHLAGGALILTLVLVLLRQACLACAPRAMLRTSAD